MQLEAGFHESMLQNPRICTFYICFVQGKGTMHTYWLTGIYSADESLPVESSKFQRILQLNKRVFGDETGEDGSSEGVSVADSGIGIEDKKESNFAGSRRRRKSQEEGQTPAAFAVENLIGGESEKVEKRRNSMPDIFFRNIERANDRERKTKSASKSVVLVIEDDNGSEPGITQGRRAGSIGRIQEESTEKQTVLPEKGHKTQKECLEMTHLEMLSEDSESDTP